MRVEWCLNDRAAAAAPARPHAKPSGSARSTAATTADAPACNGAVRRACRSGRTTAQRTLSPDTPVRRRRAAGAEQHHSTEPPGTSTEGRFAEVRQKGASEVMSRIVAMAGPVDVITDRILPSLPFWHSSLSHRSCSRQPPLGCRSTDSQLPCRVANGQVLDRLETFYRHSHRRPFQTLSLRPSRSLQPVWREASHFRNSLRTDLTVFMTHAITAASSR
jgi:hypothetical protein